MKTDKKLTKAQANNQKYSHEIVKNHTIRDNIAHHKTKVSNKDLIKSVKNSFLVILL
jgi:hypothetical protein